MQFLKIDMETKFLHIIERFGSLLFFTEYSSFCPFYFINHLAEGKSGSPCGALSWSVKLTFPGHTLSLACFFCFFSGGGGLFHNCN